MLNAFQQGHMRDGMPNQVEIEAWAESLPDWAWKLSDTAAGKAARSARVKATWWQPEYAESNATRSAKQLVTNAKKREERLAKLSPEERESAERQIAKQARSVAKAKEDLALLRTIRPEATKADVKQARREGLIPRASPESTAEKHRMLVAKRQEERLAKLSPEARKSTELRIARAARAAAKKKSDLALLRTVFPEAQQRDLARARREGWMPKAPSVQQSGSS